ncbi:unnamed protein product, partial [Rotaria sp. Silwood2]
KYLEENRCDYYRPYIENEKLTINEDKNLWSYWNKFQKSISNFVSRKYFRRIVLSAIVINRLSMDIKYHGQTQSLFNILEYSNFSIYIFICY